MRKTGSIWRTTPTSTWKDVSAPWKKMAGHPPHPPPPARTSPTLARSIGWMKMRRHYRWRNQENRPFRPVRNARGSLQARSSRPAKQVKKFQLHHPENSIPLMKSWLKDTLLRLLAIPGVNRHLVTVSMKPPLVVGHVGMITLSIRSAVRRIRLRRPQEVLISDRSPSWKILAEALTSSPLVMMEAHRKINAGSTKSTRSEMKIKMPCTVLHSLPRHHVLLEMIRAVKHQLPEATELIDVNQLTRLALPHPE